MMRLFAVASLVALSGGAAAQTCTCEGAGNTRIQGAALTAALSGNTVCVPNAAGWEWQEQHRAASPGASRSGELWDFKRGPGPGIDPTARVGGWAITATTIAGGEHVSHNYLGGSSYSYKVCRVGATASYGFCPVIARPIIMSTIKTGISGCP